MIRHLRWPVAPLLDQPDVTPARIRRTLGISGTDWQRLLDQGLTDAQADKAAIRLGLWPEHIWPTWHTVALTPLDHDYLNGGWRQAWLHEQVA